MIYLLLIISFYLEGLCSMFFKTASFFPLFTLITLVFIYPYFRKYGNSFLKTCFIIGLLYDISYTNTVFVHAFLFCILGYVIDLLYHFFDKNFWMLLLMNFVVMIGYQILSFMLFLLSGRMSFSFSFFLNSIFNSITSNVIYIIILYGILWLLNKHKKIEFHH